MILMSTLLTALFGWAMPDPFDAVEEDVDAFDLDVRPDFADPPVVPLDELLADWYGDWDDEPGADDWDDDDWDDEDAIADADPADWADADVVDPWDDPDHGLPPIEPVEVLYLTEPVSPGMGDADPAPPGDFQAMFDAITNLTPPGAGDDVQMDIMMDGKKVILPKT